MSFNASCAFFNSSSVTKASSVEGLEVWTLEVVCSNSDFSSSFCFYSVLLFFFFVSFVFFISSFLLLRLLLLPRAPLRLLARVGVLPEGSCDERCSSSSDVAADGGRVDVSSPKVVRPFELEGRPAILRNVGFLGVLRGSIFRSSSYLLLSFHSATKSLKSSGHMAIMIFWYTGVLRSRL